MKNEKVTLRHGSLEDLMIKLNEAQSKKLDLVVPNNKILSMDGSLVVKHKEGLIQIEPNSTMDRHIASKLNIPYQYFIRMQENLPNLLDANINDWLSTKDTSYMLRTYRNDDDGGMSVGRAMLSNSYKVMDNIQVLQAVLDTIMKNNLDISVVSADVSETKMYAVFQFNDNKTDGGALTANYRNPDNLQVGDTVSSGFTLTNSEVGHGSLGLIPRLEVAICSNGLTSNRLAMKKTHLGSRLDDGIIEYSTDTKMINMELVMSQLKDFITQISTKKFLTDWVDELNGKVAAELTNPIEAVKLVSAEIGIGESKHDEILKYFTKGADTTINGAIQALNFYAHQQPNPDVHHEIERNLDKAIDFITSIN